MSVACTLSPIKAIKLLEAIPEPIPKFLFLFKGYFAYNDHNYVQFEI